MKSRHAFVEKCEEIDNAINNNKQYDFAVAVFDLNGLKTVNDKFGHAAGDEYIIQSIGIITSCFPKESLYRYGGDEFVAIIEGENIEKTQQYHDNFKKIINKNLRTGKPVISSGISRFDPENDNAAKGAMYRADMMMYERKAAVNYPHL